jgi:hypothetical protein
MFLCATQRQTTETARNWTQFTGTHFDEFLPRPIFEDLRNRREPKRSTRETVRNRKKPLQQWTFRNLRAARNCYASVKALSQIDDSYFCNVGFGGATTRIRRPQQIKIDPRKFAELKLPAASCQ